MKELLPLLLVLACPLIMIIMMRGMHDGSDAHTDHMEHGTPPAPPADDRIAELEREVARLKGERHGDFDQWEAGR